MLKIVLTGPESTGKTTLAQQLAGHFGVDWVPEYARVYINSLNRPYNQADLLEIAKGQVKQEEALLKETNSLVFLDTSLEVIKIWSQYRYGNCHPWIEAQCRRRQDYYYLLCYPDLPWVFDPQRENRDDRLELFGLYRRELELLGADFFVLKGLKEERFQNAERLVSGFIKN